MKFKFKFTSILNGKISEMEIPGLKSIESINEWLTIKKRGSGFVNINGELINIDCIAMIAADEED